MFFKILDALADPAVAFHRFKRGNLVHSIQDRLRLFSQHHNHGEIINKKEIRIIGLRRTGNHAISQWIARQQPGVVWVLNNILVHDNPYRHRIEYPPEQSDPEWQTKHLASEAWGKFSIKDCLIHSYEDYSFEQIFYSKIEEKHDFYLGKSLEKYDVLILRDPFNLIASRLQSGKVPVRSKNKTMVDIWIDYAKEFVGETQYLKHNKICINYNDWFIHSDYKKQVACHLKLEFSVLQL